MKSMIEDDTFLLQDMGRVRAALRVGVVHGQGWRWAGINQEEGGREGASSRVVSGFKAQRGESKTAHRTTSWKIRYDRNETLIYTLSSQHFTDLFFFFFFFQATNFQLICFWPFGFWWCHLHLLLFFCLSWLSRRSSLLVGYHPEICLWSWVLTLPCLCGASHLLLWDQATESANFHISVTRSEHVQAPCIICLLDISHKGFYQYFSSKRNVS